MITTYHLGNTTIATLKIQQGEKGTRRIREKEAITALVNSMLPGKELLHRADGSPYVSQGPNISISHSQRLAVLAINHSLPIGVDAEEWRDALNRVKNKFLTAPELTYCDNLLLAWCIKEAVYKAGGIKEMTSHDIIVSPDLHHASALGTSYSLEHFMLDNTCIALATKIVSV